MNYVEPVTHKYVADNLNTATFQYVPLLESLRVLLNNDSFRSNVLRNHTSTDTEIYQDYADGSIFKNHALFTTCTEEMPVLQIVAYSDEFQVVNPLGPHTKKQKVLAFYYLIGNMPSHFKARKPVMQLLALCKSKDVKEYGLEAVARLLNLELSVLENEGIVVPRYPNRVRGALSYISGDNLNSNMLGGFQCSFGPNVVYPCRFCITTNLQMQESLASTSFTIRTKEMYDDHCHALNNTTGSVFGLKSRSSFIANSFHVAIGLPPDIMHDLLEGVVPYETALILSNLIGNKFFSLGDLNHIIRTWQYGPEDRNNRPVEISETFRTRTHIKQNAGRMWCLLRLLPLMLGSRVPTDNLYWLFLLELKTIVEIVFSFKLSKSHVLHLEWLIQDHLQAFKELFPDNNIRPKQHFLLHYVSAIEMYGPLRLCWCMRFEAKHAYFTHVAQVVHNFKNICSTLAQKHQLKLAYHLASESGLLDDILETGTTIEVQWDLLLPDIIQMLQDNGMNRFAPLHTCKRVTINGISYYLKMYIVIRVENDIPMFGHIIGIYLQDRNVSFVVHGIQSEFHSEVGAYCLFDTPFCTEVVTYSSLCDFYPLSAYSLLNKKYVVLKHVVFNPAECCLY